MGLETWVPDYDKKPAPNSEQISHDHFINTKPRGKGPDPIKDTYLDKTPEEVVRPLEVIKDGKPVDPVREMMQKVRATKKGIDKVKAQISSELGKLPAPTPGPDLHKSFSLDD